MDLQTLLVALVLLIIGIAFCFGGYKWFMILLPVWSFLVGFVIGASAVSGVYGKSIFSIIVIIVAGLIVGLLLAALVYLFFNLAVILLGASFGFTIGSGIAAYIGFEERFILLIAGLIVAIIVGILAYRLNLPKYIIIALTALMGSEAILSAAFLLTGLLSLGELNLGSLGQLFSQSTYLGIFWLALAAVGAAIQLQRSRAYELDLQPEVRRAGS